MINRVHPGDVIAEAMREQNLSANELARRSGVPQPTITRIINKQSSDPENATLGKIARALGKTVAQLRGEAPNLVEQGKSLYAVPNVKPAPPLKPVPLVSWEQLKQSLQSPKKAAAKNWGGESFMLMHTTRSVSRDAFALKLSDDTMESPKARRVSRKAAPSLPTQPSLQRTAVTSFTRLRRTTNSPSSNWYATRAATCSNRSTRATPSSRNQKARSWPSSSNLSWIFSRARKPRRTTQTPNQYQFLDGMEMKYTMAFVIVALVGCAPPPLARSGDPVAQQCEYEAEMAIQSIQNPLYAGVRKAELMGMCMRAKGR